jgi:hypothetical protein
MGPGNLARITIWILATSVLLAPLGVGVGQAQNPPFCLMGPAGTATGTYIASRGVPNRAIATGAVPPRSAGRD